MRFNELQQMSCRITSLLAAAVLCGCATHHTLESTENLSDRELAALCADLKMRADMDCRWNMQEQQSSVPNQQTWEINCRARRDSARESFDNVCSQPRLEQQPKPPGDH
jgi:hypothetical protein